MNDNNESLTYPGPRFSQSTAKDQDTQTDSSKLLSMVRHSSITTTHQTSLTPIYSLAKRVITVCCLVAMCQGGVTLTKHRQDGGKF